MLLTQEAEPGLKSQSGPWLPSEPPSSFELPLLPWEDVYWYVKRVDNRRLVRATDPAARRSYWHFIRASLLVLALLMAALLPGALERWAARRLAVAELRQKELAAERLELLREEAALTSPAQLDKWARKLHMVEPAPGQWQNLTPKSEEGVSARAGLPANHPIAR